MCCTPHGNETKTTEKDNTHASWGRARARAGTIAMIDLCDCALPSPSPTWRYPPPPNPTQHPQIPRIPDPYSSSRSRMTPRAPPAYLSRVRKSSERASRSASCRRRSGVWSEHPALAQEMLGTERFSQQNRLIDVEMEGYIRVNLAHLEAQLVAQRRVLCVSRGT